MREARRDAIARLVCYCSSSVRHKYIQKSFKNMLLLSNFRVGKRQFYIELQEILSL
jgi:hypothetical protein